MKLVEILAKELEEWPTHAFVAVQDDDDDHTIWFLQSDHRDLSFISCGWKCESPFDILISRPSQLAHDHATAIVTEADWKKEARSIPDQSAVGEIYNSQAIPQGPLQWRDRIAEIDVDIKFEEDRYNANMACMNQERAELVQKLAGEGFALIGRAVDRVEDMSDWRNWKVGDLVERVKDGEESGMELNTPMKITSFDWDDKRGQSVEVDSSYFPFVSSLIWHSRPSS